MSRGPVHASDASGASDVSEAWPNQASGAWGATAARVTIGTNGCSRLARSLFFLHLLRPLQLQSRTINCRL